MSYAVVGVFVTQAETKEDIAEALKVFQKWNSDWNPSHFIVDFCEAEISALEEVFKGMFKSVQRAPIMGNERFIFWFWESPTTG